MEREADRVGYGVMTDAGYEPQGFVSMFEKLQQAARLNDNGAFPYLRSHPMTTERIADAQARQQLLPAKKQLPPNALHAMMAARALVLTSPGIDVLRGLSAQADASAMRQAPPVRLAGVLYGAVMADMKQRDFTKAQQRLLQLQRLKLDAAAQRVVRLLQAELHLNAGAASLAVDVLSPHKTNAMNTKDRATLLSLARSRVATEKPEQVKFAAQEMSQWLTLQPRDASAWLVLSAAYEREGDGLRAIRAQAEARAMELDYPAALDRFKAAQDLARQLARENKLDRAGHIEAAIVDARLRELEALRREQALQR
jgi:predicted Zn-dependent protease